MFNSRINLKFGNDLIKQQMKALLWKRCLLFYRRFFLAATILLFPIIFETIFVYYIPSQTYLINQFSNLFQNRGSYRIDIKNYGKTYLPYYLHGTYSLVPVRSLLSQFYTASHRPNVELIELTSDNVTEYILARRKEDIENLVENFYFGMSLNVTSEYKIFTTIYYSTMAFHTSATILNEVLRVITFISDIFVTCEIHY